MASCQGIVAKSHVLQKLKKPNCIKHNPPSYPPFTGGFSFLNRQHPAIGLVVPPVFEKISDGVAMIGTKPGIVEIYSFGIDFFDDRIVAFLVSGNPICHHNQIAFKTFFYVFRCGIFFNKMTKVMFFKQPQKTSISRSLSGSSKLLGYPVDILFDTGSVQNNPCHGRTARPVISLFIGIAKKLHITLIKSYSNLKSKIDPAPEILCYISPPEKNFRSGVDQMRRYSCHFMIYTRDKKFIVY